MRVAHVVRSDGFAGVEAHILALAPALVDLGVDIQVIGGDPARMTDPLRSHGIYHYPAVSVRDVTEQAIRLRTWKPDLIHSHMTAAECGVLAAYPVLRAPMVSTRHFAETRGPGTRWERPYRLLDRVAEQVSVSHAVAEAIGTPSTVIYPGVVDYPTDGERGRTILIAQRLETEKDTSLGIEAFRRSGLADRGWQLLIAGRGAEEAALRDRPDRAVEILGYRSDVRELMARASIFLATSILRALRDQCRRGDGRCHPRSRHGSGRSPGDRRHGHLTKPDNVRRNVRGGVQQEQRLSSWTAPGHR